MARNILTGLFVLVFFLLVGCDNGVENSDTGTLSVKLTDTPFPISLVSEAEVTINKIEIREDSSGSSGSPFIVLSENEFTYNLLDLQNGVTADLVELEIPTGDYNLIRLYVSEAKITLADGTVYNLMVPSGAQTGIKIFINPSIKVAGGLTAELVLDFDVSQSFIVQGNPFSPAGISGFIFEPVIRAVNNSVAGNINGRVIDSDENALENAAVWIEEGDMTYSAFTDPDGYFMLSFIPEGTYTVYTTKQTAEAEYDTVSVENVEVMAGNATQLGDLVLTQQ